MEHTQDYLDAIRTAAADCRALGNTAAANELLGAAAQVAALKAQRDELLAGLERIANPIPYEQANVPEGYTLDGHALLAQVSKPLYYQTVARALIAKHKEASHG